MVVAIVARVAASAVSAPASTPLVAACAALAAVSSSITPTIVLIPSYRLRKPSIILHTICQALPLPFNASVIFSTLPAIPFTAPQEVVKDL